MSVARPTILLTGFGAFPGVATNATAALVPQLAERARARLEARVVAEILPTEWRRAPSRLALLVAEHAPTLALHFGVSHRARGIVIETLARNACAMEPDAAGELPLSPTLIGDGPRTLAASLPVTRILDRLGALGLPASLSQDAGDYLCNALLYRSLSCRTVAQGRRMAGFIHLPASLAGEDGAPGPSTADHALDWDGAIRGGLAIIAVAMEHWDSSADVSG